MTQSAPSRPAEDRLAVRSRRGRLQPRSPAEVEAQLWDISENLHRAEKAARVLAEREAKEARQGHRGDGCGHPAQ
jgi:hypothetical protein